MTENSAPPPQNSFRVGLAATVLLLLAGGALVWWLLPSASALGFDTTVEGTAVLIRSWGAWGVLGAIGLMVVHSFLPFPAEIVALANGMVYGPLWGTVITWVGAMLGASAAFSVVRLFGRPFVQRFLPPHHRERLATWSHERGGVALLISRLIPVIAFNLVNYAAALIEISWWTFLWATGVGILPFTILLAVLGDRMLTMPLWGWLLVVVVAVMIWLILERRWRVASKRKNATTSDASGSER